MKRELKLRLTCIEPPAMPDDGLVEFGLQDKQKTLHAGVPLPNGALQFDFVVGAQTDGVLKFEPVGVNFGKLGVDPRVPYAPNLGLGGLKSALGKELASFDRLAVAEPHEEITMVEGKPQRRGWIKIVTKAP